MVATKKSYNFDGQFAVKTADEMYDVNGGGLEKIAEEISIYCIEKSIDIIVDYAKEKEEEKRAQKQAAENKAKREAADKCRYMGAVEGDSSSPFIGHAL